jgi:hypothetical protein
MTEAEFNCCDDPRAMLEWLDRNGHASLRRLKLLFGACCSRITEEGGRRAGATRARHAPGAAVRPTVRHAGNRLDEIEDACGSDVTGGPIALVDSNARFCLFLAAAEALRAVPGGNHARAALVRDIFGPLPFRPVTIAPSLLEWRDGAIVKLARATDGEHGFPKRMLDPNRLIVLAAYLVTAGCADDTLLEHLRGEGPHFRGCWAVDKLTGRQ